MDIPWDRLGIPAFLAVSGEDAVYFESGRVSDPPGDRTALPAVTWGGTDPAAGRMCFEGRLLALVLHPTLTDHELETVCDLHRVPVQSGERARAIGEAFVALVEETARLERDVVALLARLVPEPLAGLLSRALLLPDRPPPDEAAGPAGVLEPPEPLRDAFSEDGFIARALPNFERRDGQVDMAEAVGRTFRQGGALVVEAGPGTGKTFAYLVPAIEALVEERAARVVVSTRTKQLQEQLFAEDLPFLLARTAPELRVALLKGRENYLCLRRWDLLVREFGEGLERDRLRVLAPLVRWMWETETGDIDENAAFLSDPAGREVWRRLCDSHHACIGSVCPHLEECFSVRARRRARRADLAVVNHSLLLNDLAVDRVVLGKYSHAILDEAHAIEETARSAFTATLSTRGIERLGDDLAPNRRGRIGWLDRLGLSPGDEGIRAARNAVGVLHTRSASLFAALGRILPADRRGRLGVLEAAAGGFERLADAIGRLESAIVDLLDRLDDPELVREGEGHASFVQDLAALVGRLSAPPEPETVRWYEREQAGPALHITPLDVAPILTRALYPELDAVVLTSATLSVDGDFRFVRRALGLDAAFDEVEEKVVESAFRYRDRMRVCVPTSLPSVVEGADGYADALAVLLRDLAHRLGRKGLVLFTSYQLLDAVRTRLPEEIAALSQGVDGPRSKLTDRFRRLSRGVLLLGTDSFWEGVDLPGEELEFLVITRLPFAVPTDPIHAALGEFYARSGLDPFLDLALPKAVLKLRQGVGRLIRTRRDRGAVVLTDRRILEKGYGRAFVDALPARVEVFGTVDTLVEEIGTWFDPPAGVELVND